MPTKFASALLNAIKHTYFTLHDILGPVSCFDFTGSFDIFIWISMVELDFELKWLWLARYKIIVVRLRWLPSIFSLFPSELPNFIHAWKYECHTRDYKSMRGLRLTGFLKYNVPHELSCVEIEMWFFTRKLFVHFSRVC